MKLKEAKTHEAEGGKDTVVTTALLPVGWAQLYRSIQRVVRKFSAKVVVIALIL